MDRYRPLTLASVGSLGLGVISGASVVLEFDIIAPDVGSPAGRALAASALIRGLRAAVRALAEGGRPPSRRWACTGVQKWTAVYSYTGGSDPCRIGSCGHRPCDIAGIGSGTPALASLAPEDALGALCPTHPCPAAGGMGSRSDR